jgi:hypothetical protein
MKTLLIPSFILGFALSSIAQNCKYDKNETDQFTGKVNRMTVSKPVATYKMNKLKASALRSGDNYYLSLFFSKGIMSGCVSKRTSYISIKFIDNEILTLKHIGDSGCGDLKILSVNITDYLNELKSKDILLIRYVIESSIDIELNDPKSISKIIACIQ